VPICRRVVPIYRQRCRYFGISRLPEYDMFIHPLASWVAAVVLELVPELRDETGTQQQ